MSSNVKTSEQNTSFTFKTNVEVMKKHCEGALLAETHEDGDTTGKKAENSEELGETWQNKLVTIFAVTS